MVESATGSEDAAVVLGMSLRERLTYAGPPTAGTTRSDAAERRLTRWRSGSSFEAAGSFARRLEADGIDERVLLRMLGDDAPSLASRLTGRPEWLRFYAEAFQDNGAVEFPVEDRLNFARLLQPLLFAADRRLRDSIGSAHQVVEKASPALRRSVLPMLHAMLSRSVILELNVARLQGALADLPTSEQRFHAFLDGLARPDRLRRFLDDHPVLARQICTALINWADSTALFCRRLSADLPVLARTFSPEGDLGGVLAVELGMGDRHAGGRTVGSVTFGDGSRVVYKPRPVGVDIHFQDLLGWLNVRGLEHPFRTLRYLDRNTYGWAEHVSAAYARSDEEVHRFYRRQGGLLAVLHLLDASDLHAENVIAAGDQPVIVDLETLLQPRILTFPPDVLDAERAADLDSVGSVLRSGLLPMAVWLGTGNAGVDLSGLGRQAGQLTPMPVPGFEREGMEDMHIGLARREVVPSENRPRPHSERLRLTDFVADLEEGFREVYEVLRFSAEELTADDGPLAAFAGDEVRVLRRSTVEYGAVLDTSLHPDLTRDGLDLDRHFDRLWRRAGVDPALAAFIPDERADLWNNDIPYFTARAGGRDVRCSRGNALPLRLDGSSLDAVCEKAGRLDDVDLAHQSWLLRAAVLTASTELERGRAFVPMYVEAVDGPQDPVEKAVSRAAQIAHRLGELSYPTESHVSWLGLSLTDGTRWTLGRVGPDLCTGTAGIALFLATLADLTKEPRHVHAAGRATATLREQLRRGDLQGRGGMAGTGGALYALMRLALLLGDETLLVDADELVDGLRATADGDTSYDVIGGCAGSIGGLLALYAIRPSDRLLSAVRACADRLVARAEPTGPGVGWLPSAFVATGIADRPLSGFAHGNAGIAWALGRAATALQDHPRLMAAAAAALTYERTLYDPEERNWLDLRTDPGGGSTPARAFMTAWCHGAAGIGMSRVGLPDALGDHDAAAEIAVSLDTVRRTGFGLNHSLCHGDLGNLDLLQQTGADDADRLARLQRVLATIDRYGVVPGTPLAIETPGLLTGLAGVGYGLLRAARPDAVPSVLTLQPLPDDRAC